MDERGEVFRSGRRQGNFISSEVIQAGQVLLFQSGHLFAKLSRKQLSMCLTALCDMGTALNKPVNIMLWNGHPIDVSPVAGFIYEHGFRFDSRGWLCWPLRGKEGKIPEPCTHEEFLPYYAEPDPVDYNYDWVVSRVTPLIRPKLEELLKFLATKLTDEHRLIFDQSGFSVTYRDQRCIWPYVQKKYIWMVISHKGWTPGIMVTSDTDLNGREFKDEFNREITRNMEIIDAYLAKRKRNK